MIDDKKTSVSQVLASGIAGPPTPPPGTEPEVHQLRRWEEFYKYAQDSYERAHDRWTAADEKAWKYLSILGLLLGAGAITSGQFAKVFARADTYGEWLFVVSYVAAVVFAVAAFGYFLSALQLQDSSAPPTRPEMVQFFSQNRYIDILYGLGRDTLAAAEQTRVSVDRKFVAADNGFQLMRLAGVCLLLASVAYFAIQVRNAPEADASAGATITVVNGADADGSESRRSGTEIRPPQGELRGTAPPAAGDGRQDGLKLEQPK